MKASAETSTQSAVAAAAPDERAQGGDSSAEFYDLVSSLTTATAVGVGEPDTEPEVTGLDVLMAVESRRGPSGRREDKTQPCSCRTARHGGAAQVTGHHSQAAE